MHSGMHGIYIVFTDTGNDSNAKTSGSLKKFLGTRYVVFEREREVGLESE